MENSTDMEKQESSEKQKKSKKRDNVIVAIFKMLLQFNYQKMGTKKSF